MSLKEKLIANKNKIFTGCALIASFVLGFSAQAIKKTPLSAYTNNSATAAKSQKPDPNCPIKGKTSKAGAKLYYLSGHFLYKKIKPEKCFNTEQEALDAGYKKSY